MARRTNTWLFNIRQRNWNQCVRGPEDSTVHDEEHVGNPAQGVTINANAPIDDLEPGDLALARIKRRGIAGVWEVKETAEIDERQRRSLWDDEDYTTIIYCTPLHREIDKPYKEDWEEFSEEFDTSIQAATGQIQGSVVNLSPEYKEKYLSDLLASGQLNTHAEDRLREELSHTENLLQSANFWMIRAGEEGVLWEEWNRHTPPIITIGWDVGSPNEVDFGDKQELKREISRRHGGDDSTPASQLRQFVGGRSTHVKPGDYVVILGKASVEAVAQIGKFRYEEEGLSDEPTHTYWREVDYLLQSRNPGAVSIGTLPEKFGRKSDQTQGQASLYNLNRTIQEYPVSNNDFIELIDVLSEYDDMQTFDKAEHLIALYLDEQEQINLDEWIRGDDPTFFILRTGNDEYEDRPRDMYHFREGIPGYNQFLNDQSALHAVYLEDKQFYGIGRVKNVTSNQQNGETHYHAEIEGYHDIGPIDCDDIEGELSANVSVPNGIIKIDEDDFRLIVDQETTDESDGYDIHSAINELLIEEDTQDHLYRQGIAHLIAGKNVVFYGPPGTGKTRAADLLTEAVCASKNLVTANAEWSNYQVVGGFRPAGGSWEPKPGFLTATASKCNETLCQDPSLPSWLIIDELNRANLDEAFGDVFTLLDLDYRTSEPLSYANEEVYVPLSFRILATMNTYDQAQLFSLGYAFRRRFAFVSVPSLLERQDTSVDTDSTTITRASATLDKTGQELVDLVEKAAVESMTRGADGEGVVPADVAPVFPEFASEEMLLEALDSVRDRSAFQTNGLNGVETLVYLCLEITDRDVITIGQALLIDATKYLIAHQLLFPEETTRATLDEAVVAYIVPQFEHFMSELRRAETIDRDSDAKERFDQIIQLARDLDLPRTASVLDEAKDTKRILS